MPVAVAWFYTDHVLLRVGYSTEESYSAGLFNRWYILSLFPMMWYICIQNYLQGRGDAMPALYTNVGLLFVNGGLNFILIFGIPGTSFSGFGFIGPAYLLISIFFVSLAVLQGQSRSLAIMASFLPGAWGVSVPLAFVFVLVLHLGLEGLWGALVAGYATITITAAAFVLRSDWDRLSVAAIERSKSSAPNSGSSASDNLRST